MRQDLIAILDLGGRNSTTIAREIRDFGVYSEIHPHDVEWVELNRFGNVKGLIINGASEFCLDVLEDIKNRELPVLSVCSEIPGDMSISQWPEDELELKSILRQFVIEKCKANANWNMTNFITGQVSDIKNQIGNGKVLLALSGGVDSTVVAALLTKAIGRNLVCVHVNHGLMRKNESEHFVDVFRNMFDANLVYVDASERFLQKLANVSDPELKRKIIGEEFIRVFEDEAKKQSGISFLAQGTIYPDIIESGTKTAKLVKSHHNVGGLPENLNFELVEPLRQLFKDEVRKCGDALGLPYELVYRQPFPGPGLGVRCLGAITPERLAAVRDSDAILREEFAEAGLEGKIWQYFTIVPEFKSVGVRDHERCIEYPVIIRAINTIDAMTAEVPHIDWTILDRIAKRIINEVKGVNRVCYDLTPKPTGTVEWE